MNRFAVLAFLVCSATLAAQRGAPPRFEVASVKRSPPYAERVLQPVVGGGQRGLWRLRDQPLIAALRQIYPGHQLPGQIAGLPEWGERDFYDIEARTNPAATVDEVRQMVRVLFAERFKLAVHEERRELPAFVLVARKDGKLGKGLTPPAVDCTAFRAGGQRPDDPTRKQYADRLACGVTALPVFDHTQLVAGADMRITAGDVPFSSILTLLATYLRRPVVDRTGLTQRFDIELQFSAGAVRADGDNGPPIRAAIAEQFGLQVDEERTAVDVLVIDHIERPTEN